MKTLIPVFFLMLFTNSTFGGEWHSAGNTPRKPYISSTPATYTCQWSVITSVSPKMYRMDYDIVFAAEEFKAGGASRELTKEVDPGMNGQMLSLSFDSNSDGGEDVVLRLRAKSGPATSSATFKAPRGKVTGQISLSRGTKSVSQTVECKEI